MTDSFAVAENMTLKSNLTRQPMLARNVLGPREPSPAVRVRKILSDLNISLLDLAEMMEVSASAIRNIANKKKKLSEKMELKLKGVENGY